MEVSATSGSGTEFRALHGSVLVVRARIPYTPNPTKGPLFFLGKPSLRGQGSGVPESFFLLFKFRVKGVLSAGL